MGTNILIFLSIIFFVLAICLSVIAAKREKMLEFLTTAHYVSLGIILLGSVLTWVALTWMSDPEEFNVKPRQRIALVFSLLLGLFFWGRFVFTIEDDVEKACNK